MEEKEHPSKFARRLLELILDYSNCENLGQLVGADEVLRLCSAEERKRLDWGLWMASFAVSAIAFIHEPEVLDCESSVLETIGNSIDQQLADLIPKDLRRIRVGSLVTNKGELEYLKSNGRIQHS